METFTNCTDLSLNCCESDTVSDILSDHDQQERRSLFSQSGDSNSRSVDDALFLVDDACKNFGSEIDYLPVDILYSDKMESKSSHQNDNLLEVAAGFWLKDDKHPKQNWQTNLGILCSKCDQKFISKIYFDKHFAADHSGSDLIYTCSCCHKQFQSYSSFRNHCYRHYKSKISKLSQSSHLNEQKENDVSTKSTQNEKILNKTVSRENIWISDYGITCKICNKKFFKKITFDKHFESSHPNFNLSYTCSCCNQIYQDYSKFRNHCYRHTTNKKYKCKFCLKSYSQQSNLLKHIDVKHLDKKKFACHLCNKFFFTLKGLQLHTNNNHMNNILQYKCPHCNKVLQTRSGYDSHVKEFHTKATLFNCSICKLQFTQKCNLKEHMTRHENEPIHGCSLCSTTFRNLNDLKRHLHKVHPDNVYQCNLCNKIYKTQSHLREHMQSHTTFKAFTCNVCDKGFPTSYKLEQHFNTHIGLKPHKCQHCNTSYANYSNLLKHLRLKHNTKITKTNDENDNTLKFAVSTMSVINATENAKQSVITDNGNNLRNELINSDKPVNEKDSDQNFEDETFLISCLKDDPNNITVLSMKQEENTLYGLKKSNNFNPLTDHCFVLPRDSNSLNHYGKNNILCVLLLQEEETSVENEGITLSSPIPEIENQTSNTKITNTCSHIILDDSHSKVLSANYTCNSREKCFDEKINSLITNNNDKSAMDCNPSTSILIHETNKYRESNDLHNITDTHSDFGTTLSSDKDLSSLSDEFVKDEQSLGDELVASMSLEDLDLVLNEADTEFNFDNFAELNNVFTFGENNTDDTNIIFGF